MKLIGILEKSIAARHLPSSVSIALVIGLSASSVAATPLDFSSATATFNQNYDRNWSPSEMIDGITSGTNGWADYQDVGDGDQTFSETALLTLASPLAAGAQSLKITIYQNVGASHLLGDFSLGYATDASPTLSSGQTPLTVTAATSLNGTTFSYPSQGQILAGGALPDTDVYTITVTEDSVVPITGLFLNVINDSINGLPTGGPGRQPSNGNFVVSELTAATPTPEPASWVMMMVGLGGAGATMRRRRSIAPGAVSAAA